MADAKPMLLHLLPTEIIFKILRYLDCDTLVNVSCSCKRLSTLLDDETFWRGVFYDLYKTTPGLHDSRIEHTWNRALLHHAFARADVQSALQADPVVGVESCHFKLGQIDTWYYHAEKRILYVSNKRGTQYIALTETGLSFDLRDLSIHASRRSITYLRAFEFGLVYGLKDGVIGVSTWSGKPFHRQFRASSLRRSFGGERWVVAALKNTTLVAGSTYGDIYAWDVVTGKYYGTASESAHRRSQPYVRRMEVFFPDTNSILAYAVYEPDSPSTVSRCCWVSINLPTMTITKIRTVPFSDSVFFANETGGAILDQISCDAAKSALIRHGVSNRLELNLMESLPLGLIAFAPPGRLRLMATSLEAGIVLWLLGTERAVMDVLPCHLIPRTPEPGRITALALSLTLLAAATANGFLFLFDVVDAACLGRMRLTVGPDKNTHPSADRVLREPTTIELHPVLAQGVVFSQKALAAVFFDFSRHRRAV